MTKPLTCLFLGSGASYALAGIPIQRDFLCSVLTEERAEWIDGCGLEINGIKLSDWMVHVGDIELCMSHLHNLAYSNLATTESRPRAKKAIINLRAAMAQYLHGFESQGHVADNFRKWRKTFKNPLVILTTNYDLVLEKLLGNQGYKIPEIPFKRGPRKNNADDVSLYKLHGSIDWMEERKFRDSEIVGIEPVKINDKVPLKNPGSENDYRVFKYKKKFYTPILIPFFYQKEDWFSQRWRCVFKNHWSAAFRHLTENKIERIYFLGYGLPSADHYMLSWLLNILELGKANKPKITIVRKGADEPTLLERALDPFIKSNEESKVYECGLENFLDSHV